MFLFFNASLLQLQTSQKLTTNEKEQLYLETLFQMGNATFQNGANSLQVNGETTYRFPYGTVTVEYVILDSNDIQAQFTMVTSDGSKNIVNRIIYIDP
ncbi:competence type IV pilus minor pilin ComGG [Pontibacillus sp. HMF3514]|uniref:competence type IV pilus minor pilin ComGG n=1 Tax=Pontibacillus sp. HMF3514 TaxID=2692425 RepID=UPI00131FB35D|nr:competence type IV pilus minor pilin ComGG [Pontibacillus sp. HMF3514]QHE52950.1 hypothetical protein GS400_13345 [Pontibacillus sp. HMF3514]